MADGIRWWFDIWKAKKIFGKFFAFSLRLNYWSGSGSFSLGWFGGGFSYRTPSIIHYGESSTLWIGVDPNEDLSPGNPIFRLVEFHEWPSKGDSYETYF